MLNMKRLTAEFKLIRVMLKELSCKPCRYSELESHVVAKTGTYATFNSILYFLRKSGFILKDESYRLSDYYLSEKGKLLLEALTLE
jgi:predicted transcriptional regulator